MLLLHSLGTAVRRFRSQTCKHSDHCGYIYCNYGRRCKHWRQKLNAKKDGDVKVSRDGKEQLSSVHEIIGRRFATIGMMEYWSVIMLSNATNRPLLEKSDAIRKLQNDECISDSDVKATTLIISGSSGHDCCWISDTKCNIDCYGCWITIDCYTRWVTIVNYVMQSLYTYQ